MLPYMKPVSLVWRCWCPRANYFLLLACRSLLLAECLPACCVFLASLLLLVHSFFADCSLHLVFCFLLFCSCLLLLAYCFLLRFCCFFLIVYCILLSASCCLLLACCFLLIACCFLLLVCWFFAYCSLHLAFFLLNALCFLHSSSCPLLLGSCLLSIASCLRLAYCLFKDSWFCRELFVQGVFHHSPCFHMSAPLNTHTERRNSPRLITYLRELRVPDLRRLYLALNSVHGRDRRGMHCIIIKSADGVICWRLFIAPQWMTDLFSRLLEFSISTT